MRQHYKLHKISDFFRFYDDTGALIDKQLLDELHLSSLEKTDKPRAENSQPKFPSSTFALELFNILYTKEDRELWNWKNEHLAKGEKPICLRRSNEEKSEWILKVLDAYFESPDPRVMKEQRDKAIKNIDAHMRKKKNSGERKRKRAASFCIPFFWKT